MSTNRRAAVVEDGQVVNVIVVREDDDPAKYGAIWCPDEVGPGWTYDGETWTPPPNPEEG